jgi:hypothetical protein
MKPDWKERRKEWKHHLTVMRRTLSPRHGWSSLRALGTSRVVKSSYVWLMLVPVGGKCLSAVNDVTTFTILGTEISVHLSLPFSWKAFFFAALAFALADLIWQIKCPDIIKKYANYTDFLSQGRTALDTKHYFLETVSGFFMSGRTSFEKIQAMQHMKAFLKAATGRRFSMLTEEDFKFFQEPSDIPTQNVDRILGYEVEKEKESNLFHFVVKRSQNLRFRWLCLCSACYVVGFLLMTIVLCQSIWTVITI